MSYNRGYQGGSPWASGAPPQMYGGPPMPPAHPQQQHSGYGGGAPAYGSPQVAPAYGYGRHQMAPNHPINPPVPPVWGQGPIGGAGPMQMNHQRSGNMRPIGGPTGKRSGGHWNEMPPNKRFNRNNRGSGQNNMQGGNRKDVRKFDNNRHQFPRDNRKNQNNKQKDNEKRQQKNQDQVQKTETLEKKEYPIVKGTEGKTDTAVKNGDLNQSQSKYVIAVNGYCCKLCDVFIRDKAASIEHCETESHIELFKKAEEERLQKEKEEDEKKKKEKEATTEKVNDETQNENKDNIETEENANDNTDEAEDFDENEENLTGDGVDENESTLPLNGDIKNCEENGDKTTVAEKENGSEMAEVNETSDNNNDLKDDKKQAAQVENKSDTNDGDSNQQPIDLSESTGETAKKPVPSETVSPNKVESVEQQTPVQSAPSTPVQNFNAGNQQRGGMRGPPRGRAPNRGGANRGNRGNNRARATGRGRR